MIGWGHNSRARGLEGTWAGGAGIWARVAGEVGRDGVATGGKADASPTRPYPRQPGGFSGLRVDGHESM